LPIFVYLSILSPKLVAPFSHRLPCCPPRRRQEKAERRAQLKKEGKLLTGKAKAEAERLARAREQFLRQAGIDPDAVGGCFC
jgi:hypothetical protein